MGDGESDCIWYFSNNLLGSPSVPIELGSLPWTRQLADMPAIYKAESCKINATDAGFCATIFNSFRGWGTADSGATEIPALAALQRDGPNND